MGVMREAIRKIVPYSLPIEQAALPNRNDSKVAVYDVLKDFVLREGRLV